MAITGASGMIYARMLMRALDALGTETHVIASPDALTVIQCELGISMESGQIDPSRIAGEPGGVHRDRFVVHGYTNLSSALSSGTFRHDGMVVCPCSMKTLGLIASGTGGNLICRAADVCLKEKFRLVLVPRETPLSLVHLRNMTSAAEAGAMILPAMPGFYGHPACIEDLAAQLVTKIIDSLELDGNSAAVRWQG